MRERMNTEEFAARVAAPLKAGVPVSDGFEARVMRAVEQAPRTWWRRPLAMTPLRLVAMAAGFGALMVLGGYRFAQRGLSPVTVAAASADTVHLVRFVFADANATSVALAGDFNGWSRTATLLEPAGGAGLWVIEVPLAPGRHEYAFVVDGERWVADPTARSSRDEFGQESSVIRVGREVSFGT